MNHLNQIRGLLCLPPHMRLFFFAWKDFFSCKGRPLPPTSSSLEQQHPSHPSPHHRRLLGTMLRALSSCSTPFPRLCPLLDPSNLPLITSPQPTKSRLFSTLSSKEGNDLFYKGSGGIKGGRNTSKGRFLIDPLKRKYIQFSPSMLTDFPLKPYVARATDVPPKVEEEPPASLRGKINLRAMIGSRLEKKVAKPQLYVQVGKEFKPWTPPAQKQKQPIKLAKSNLAKDAFVTRQDRRKARLEAESKTS